MCVPAAAVAVISAVATTASVAYAGYSQYQQAKYQAGVAATNAVYADRAAVAAQNAGTQEEMAHAQQVAQLRAAQRADYGAMGVDTTFGSAANVLADTSYLGQQDALRIRQNTQQNVQGYSIEGQNYRAQQAGANMAATSALVGTGLSVGSSILSGYAKVGETVGKYGAPSWMGGVGRSMEAAYKLPKLP